MAPISDKTISEVGLEIILSRVLDPVDIAFGTNKFFASLSGHEEVRTGGATLIVRFHSRW
jgi:hypothetical protein